jgi:hypothetical protein
MADTISPERDLFFNLLKADSREKRVPHIDLASSIKNAGINSLSKLRRSN